MLIIRLIMMMNARAARSQYDKLKCGVIKCEKNKNKSHELEEGESAQNKRQGRKVAEAAAVVSVAIA